MPAIVPITINDGQTTPVAHVFSPESVRTDGGKTIAVFADRSSGIIVGYWRLKFENLPKNKNGMFKVRVVVERATLETLSNNTSSGINPAPTRAYTTTGQFEMWAHERSTAQERKDVRMLAINLLSWATAASVFENLESWY